ncbi:AraC family transcriptional regulator [Salidesulfovibrio onnuriiensis]|uniref:AraC family transcriptional regulator n=1 Tax=Salidesulfovibrio onnuriiensis TaxID=2583823 RepID=UPI0032B76CAB
MPAHTHDCYVFWVNGAGGENVNIGGNSAVLQPDSFGSVAPGDVHSNHGLGERRRLLSFYVPEEILQDVARQMGCRGESPSAFCSTLHTDGGAYQTLQILHGVLSRDAECSYELFLRVFSMLLRRHGVLRRGEARRAPAPEKVRRAMGLMREDLSAPLALDSLAGECGCTPYHLIRLFRREIGFTPHAWLMDARVSLAQRLLRAGVAPCEVALSSGFADQSHLNRRFKARFGITPGMYRRQVCAR